jgi:hypothetical protein
MRNLITSAIALTALAVSACDTPTQPALNPAHAAPNADLVSFADGLGYTMVDISNWYGTSEATGINAGGTIVGYHGNVGWETGFILTGQTYTSISPPLGFSNTRPTDINDNGVVVGYSTDYYNSAKWIGWVKLPGQSPTALNKGTCAVTSADGINNVGDVVGMCDSKPALWHDLGASSPVILKSLSDASPTGEARDINDAGIIVGRTKAPGFWGNNAPVYWTSPSQPGLVTISGSLGGEAVSINKYSAVVGTYNTQSQGYGFQYGFIVPTKIYAGFPRAISDRGRVVGVRSGLPPRAFTVSSASTTEALLPVPGTGQSVASAVNTCGTVVGSYNDGALTHAVKWTKPFCDQ